MNVYEKEIIRVFRLHYENLSNLASGKLLSVKNLKNAEQKNTVSKKKERKYMNYIRSYLCNFANHNAVCEKLDENGKTDFYCQIMAGEEAYRMAFEISEEGILVLTGSYGENAFVVPEAYRYAVADYLNKENTKHKYCSMFVGTEETGVYCRMCKR